MARRYSFSAVCQFQSCFWSITANAACASGKLSSISRACNAAFRAHVSSCSHLPPEIGPGDPIKVVMRVYFKPDGTLAEPPGMLDATFSPKSSALMKIAVKALEDCQPFTELPKDKYDKWRIMDLIVTPRAMGR